MRRMSSKEKHVVQIFDRTKRIIDQAQQQFHIWEHHLFPKLILNGINPPPWLCNSPLHSLAKELNKDDSVSEVPLLQPQFAVPFPGRQCSLFNDLEFTSDNVQYPIRLQDEVHVSEKDCNAGDRISNLPNCSVNNGECASSGPSELDSAAAISPQNQIEHRASDSYNDPALLSLAKLQRSKPRQKALQLRNSAKAMKDRSGGDISAGLHANMVTGSATSPLQAGHIELSELVKDLNSNIQSCSMEEGKRGDCMTQNQNYHNSNHSGHITMSKTLAQKFNPMNVDSPSVVKEYGPTINNSDELLEPLHRPFDADGTCEFKGKNKGYYQGKGAVSTAYGEGSKKSGSSNQERYVSQSLKHGSTSGRGKRVEVHDFMQPLAHVEFTDLSNASDQNNGSRRNSGRDGGFCNKKQESISHDRKGLLRSSCPSPGGDILSAQSPESLIAQHLCDSAMPFVGSLHSEKDHEFCSAAAKDSSSSKSGPREVYKSRDSKSQNHSKEISKSHISRFCGKDATCSESLGKKPQNAWLIELGSRRLSVCKNDSKLDREIATNSSEQEEFVPIDVSRNSTAVTTSSTEASVKPASSSNLEGDSLSGQPLYFETSVTDNVLYCQDNILSGANPAHNIQEISATSFSKVVSDSVEKDRSCPGPRFTSVSPKVGLDVSIMRPPSDFVVSVMPKQLDFDDAEADASSMKGFCRPDLKEGQHGMSQEEEPINLLEPENLHDNIEERSATTVSKVVAGSVEKDRSSPGPRFTSVSPHVVLDVSGIRPPSDFVVSVMPKQLDFDNADAEASCMNGICSPDLKEGQHGMSQEEEPLNLLEPVDLHDNEASLVCQGKCNSLGEMIFVGTHEALSVEEGRQIEYCASHLEEKEKADVAGKALNVMSPNKELGILTSPVINHSSTSQVAGENSPGSLSKEVMAPEFVSQHSTMENGESSTKLDDAFSAAVTTYGLHTYTDKIVTNLTVEFPSVAPMDETNFGCLSDVKNSGFTTDLQNFKSSIESFTYDVEHSWPQHKRRKTEIETIKILPAASSSFMEKPLDSVDPRSVGRNMNVEEKSHEPEFQCLTSNQEDGTGLQYVCNHPTKEMQDTTECQTSEGFSLNVRIEEKFIMDGSDISADNLILPETNLPPSSRIYPGGHTILSGGSSVSPEIQCLDLIGTDDTVPEFEGFIIPTDNAQPCTSADQMDIDYTSLGISRFMHSPLCYSATPYKLHNIPDLYQSLPNGLLEGMGARISFPLNDGIASSHSDCLSNCKGTDTPSVQTIWDRINSNFGSSGKRQSLKLELPSINEENENMDDVADTFQNGIGSEEMARSITREPPAEIIDNGPSTSVLPDDGHVEFVSTEFSISGTQNKVKPRLDKQGVSRKRFMSKGKENQSTSLGKNGAKRTTESLLNRSSRPKLSGKDSMKRPGPTYSEGKSKHNNIVCGITSFIPLVQKKQEAAIITGKRDINVKALQTGEAAKRMLEKKENERRMRREALMQERLQKKKEEEERKKVAEMAAKKRQREEGEKKDLEIKKKRVNNGKKQQQEREKTHATRKYTEMQSQATGDVVRESNKPMDVRENHKNLQLEENRESSGVKISENQPSIIQDSANNKTKECCPKYSEAMNNCANNGKGMGNLTKAIKDGDVITKNSVQEQSYEISPYKGSDDELEEEDDVPNNKFIPLWASKQHLSRIVSSQKTDPEMIFPPQSFCNIVEVLPRKLHL